MMRAVFFLVGLIATTAAQAAEPVRIGITTILSGPMADRGQSEQNGAQLALNRVNEAGGVLGRPVEATMRTTLAIRRSACRRPSASSSKNMFRC
jgi:branched-chain amino acid transport system substrate-binding protein